LAEQPNRVADAIPERIESWDDLSRLIEHFSYFNGLSWLFRGVSKTSHGLVPKVGREETRAIKESQGQRIRVPFRETDERALFRMFMQQARPHLTYVPQSELEWLAVAQHHGTPTRLLDWSESLLVAAWFAVERGGVGDGDSAIWVARGIPSIPLDHPGDAFSVAEVCCYRPPHISPRISAQASVFVLCPNPTVPITPIFARMICISKGAQFTIKKRLNACGINRRLLFPDLGGLSDHLTWMYKHDWLAGYRPECELVETATASPCESEA
jgi:hypothetical protein